MRVFVGLSGGVDSSVAAAILKEEGHQVEGVYILGWQPPFMKCPAAEDRLDAMRVANHLGIPFRTLDLSAQYKKKVVDYLIGEYKAGRTPNPDIMCNKHIKFGGFFEWAMKEGADAIATGHYASVERENGAARLTVAKDSNKDQTYFLWAVPQEALAKTLFPIGAFTKPEVREKAKALGLPTATKKDSQGVCFLGKIDMAEFLERSIAQHKGDVLDEKGEVVGYHHGAEFITLGQRHGFTLTKMTPHEGRHYVIAKDLPANTVTVSENPHAEAPDTVTLCSCAWFNGAPKAGDRAEARARHRQKLFAVAVKEVLAADLTFQIKAPDIGPLAHGQSVVLYRNNECLGGGIISG